MKMFLLGAFVVYVINGIIILTVNQFANNSETARDIKDCVCGWPLLPFVLVGQIIYRYNYNRKIKKKNKNKG